MAKAIKEVEPTVKWFKARKHLGEVRFLPSDIDPRVLIRYKKETKKLGHYYISYGTCNEFSVVCLLNPRKRDVVNVYYDTGTGIIGNRITKGIKTPKIIFQYDFNYLNLHQKLNFGYMFRPDKNRPTLSEMLKHPKAFNFPHVYDNAYMCLSNRNHDSPRVLNNVFWDSRFNPGWGRGKKSGTSKAVYEDYIARKNSSRDSVHKTFLAKYINFFETDKKPLAIFVSKNPQILAKAKSSLIPGKELVVGFAWLAEGRWWVYLKNNTFLRFTPRQIKEV